MVPCPLSKEALPRHVAMIMDGNGRWAKARHMPRGFGHRAGVDALRGVVKASGDWGIEALTLYAFSTENNKRPKDEINTLMSLLCEYFTREIDELHENGVCIRILGRYDQLPEKPREIAKAAMARTRNNQKLYLNIALQYGGRDEIARACAQLCEQVVRGELDIRHIDEAKIAEFLDTKGLPDVDLLIRTSGELRISNFLLYQIAYAEMIFTDVLWPDFSPEEYAKALIEYGKRGRRFGGL